MGTILSHQVGNLQVLHLAVFLVLLDFDRSLGFQQRVELGCRFIVDLGSFSKANFFFLNYIKRVAKDKTPNSVLKFDARLSAEPTMWAKWYKRSVP